MKTNARRHGRPTRGPCHAMTRRRCCCAAHVPRPQAEWQHWALLELPDKSAPEAEAEAEAESASQTF